MKLVVSLVLALLFSSPVRASEIPDDKNLVDFLVNVRLVPFSYHGAPEIVEFDSKVLLSNPNYKPFGTPGYWEYHDKGLMIFGPQGNLYGYVATGGLFDGSYWKFSFDPEMTPFQRDRLLALLVPYVKEKTSALEKEWKNLKADELRPMNTLYMRVDFFNSESLSNRWLIDHFGQFPLAVFEDSSRGRELSLSEILKITPAALRSRMDKNETTKVIRGIQFGKVYSPDLRKMADINSAGNIVITDTRTGNIVATIAAAESGTPKIKMSSTQLVVDYGPGNNRYHYGVVDFTLLYQVKNWKLPSRPESGSNVCKQIFLL